MSKILKGILLSEAPSEYGANLDWAAGKASQDTNEPQKYAIEVGPNKYVGDIYTDWNEADRKRKELAKKYFQVKVVPISKMNEDMPENSMPYPHGKPEAGDKITWYHSNHYPEIEGTVLGWKDGHLIVQSVDPQPRNTEKTVAKYRVPKNNILSVKKQGIAESSEEKKECGNCHGSGRMVWDADIGTDQECFVCDGTGEVDWNDDEKDDVKEGSVTSNFKIGPKSEYDKGKADSYYRRRDRSAESPDPKEYLRGYDENDDYKDWGRDDPVDEGTSNILKGISRMVKGKPTPGAEYQKYFDAYKKAMQTGDKAAIANATRDLQRIEKVAGPAFFEGLGLPFPGTYEQERGVESKDEQLDEKWSDKYKRSIDCSHPKGFSQRAHCQGKKKKK